MGPVIGIVARVVSAVLAFVRHRGRAFVAAVAAVEVEVGAEAVPVPAGVAVGVAARRGGETVTDAVSVARG